MAYLKRYLTDQVVRDLDTKMVFIAGPRQVGKTTLAKHLFGKHKQGYLNWDITKDREAILKQQLPVSKLWIFDEIHKYTKWRNYLKGVYDQFGKIHKILVTGSARLDYYRRGGDSLQGRFHLLHLDPLSVKELKIKSQPDFDKLFQLGGFPEQFFRGSEIEAKRWSREYRQRLIQEDLLSLETVKDLGSLELLMMRLPELVGSPLSINALREDLQVSHKAVSNWLDIFSRIYAIFRLSPFGAPQLRAVKKEQKHYHYDWTLVDDEGSRFENMVAVHLLKWVHFENDTKGRYLELRYFRDVDSREVDFIVTEKTKPIMAIECKSSDKDVSKSLSYFKERFPSCAAWQISRLGKKDYLSKQEIRVCNAITFLQELV